MATNLMKHFISEDLINQKLVLINKDEILPKWEYSQDYVGYFLDLRMCQLSSLSSSYDCSFDDFSSLIRRLEKVLKLDCSLNELKTIDHENVTPYKQLRHLNASFNQIDRIVGVEILQQLRTLNLSHNFIKYIYGLEKSILLIELDLTMNHVEDLSYMPPLSNLQILHISNNRLNSLEGIQNLSYLKELYADNNFISDVLPLAGSMRLTTLDLSHNKILELTTTITVINGLKNIITVTLMDNPLCADPCYKSSFTESTNVIHLDNTILKHNQASTLDRIQTPTHKPNSKLPYKLEKLKQSARKTLLRKLADHKRQTETDVQLLQKRIISLQQDHKKYEAKINRDVDASMRYFDQMNAHDIENYNSDHHPWIEADLRESIAKKKEIRNATTQPTPKETDEVLRLAFNKLLLEQDRR